MPTLTGIAVYPIKSLDPLDCTDARLSRAGGLERDRRYAIVDENGKYVNGKRTSRVHQLHATFDSDIETVRLRCPKFGPEAFQLETNRDKLESWLSEYFGFEVSLEQKVGGKLTDGAIYGDGDDTGPTLISRSTLEEVASWFDDISLEEMRLRLRPNLIVEGVPPFWEDGLIADEKTVLEIGDTRLVPTEPVPRCVVPTRDPATGEQSNEFQRIFLKNREETLPDWAPDERFGHYFQLMIRTRVPGFEVDSRLATDELVEVFET